MRCGMMPAVASRPKREPLVEGLDEEQERDHRAHRDEGPTERGVERLGAEPVGVAAWRLQAHPPMAISKRGRPPLASRPLAGTGDGGAGGRPPAPPSTASVVAVVLEVGPGTTGRLVPALDVAEPPLDLGGRVGPPVVRDRGHLAARQRLRDTVRAGLELAALWFQPLSLVQSLSRQGNWSMPKPASSISAQPVLRLPLYSAQDAGIGPSYGLACRLSALARPRARFLRDAAAASALLARSAASLAACAARSLAWYSAARCWANATWWVGLPLALVGEIGPVDLDADLLGQALLLGFPVFAQVEATGNAHGEQRDSGRTGTQPAPQPTHEVVPSSGARTRRGPPGRPRPCRERPDLAGRADAPAVAAAVRRWDERSPTIPVVRGRS